MDGQRQAKIEEPKVGKRAPTDGEIVQKLTEPSPTSAEAFRNVSGSIVRAGDILALQKTVGNKTVQRMLENAKQPKLEARNNGGTVVQRRPADRSGSQSADSYIDSDIIPVLNNHAKFLKSNNRTISRLRKFTSSLSGAIADNARDITNNRRRIGQHESSEGHRR